MHYCINNYNIDLSILCIYLMIFSFYLLVNSFTMLSFLLNEPFGLGRFATDHSLTKAASRPLFARVRRYAP